MVLATDFSDDQKSDAGPGNSIIDSQLRVRSNAVQSTIPASSNGDIESSVGSLTEDRPPDYSTLTSAGKGLSSVAQVTSDGRLAVSLKFKQTLPDLPKDYAAPIDEFAVDPTLSEPGAALGIRAGGRVPHLNIVAMLVGTQGDVHPHLALGQELSRHGHRVRIATHGAFREIVSHAGLEFFDIGGDPNEVMGFMMRNSGLVSGFASLNRGDITRHRRSMKEILDGCWRACTQIATPGELPFIADAIIANPPSFAHVHCAEALGIPVHMTFTMPWSPTTAFPHPLVNISSSNGEPRLTNYLSYALIELMIWQRLGDLINNFRRNTLGLKRLNMRTGAGVLDKLKIPCTYAFSESLVPKPEDWRNHIDVAGFFCQEQDSTYIPPPELIAFISEGPPPIYVNFGSTPVPDPLALTRTIIESAHLAGTPVLLASLSPIPAFPFSSLPPHVFLLPPDVPASALLPYTCAVLHAGEAQLTADILRASKPSIVVPCVGDQSFWARALHRAGVAAGPIEKGLLFGGGKAKDMSRSVLVLKEAIEFALSPQVVENAKMVGDRIERENGVAAGVHSFHRHLPLLNMRCDLFPERLAIWWSPKHYLRLSGFAAQILTEVGLLDIQDLQLHRPKEYTHDPNFVDPISGGVVEVFRSIVDFHAGLAQIFSRAPVQGLINTGVALPRGVFYSIDSIQEGFHQSPRLWGSKARYEKPVKDWKGGLAEGGKALFHGVVDGVTGLITEPIDGYKNEGTIGAIKGTGRGVLNVGFRPAAGSLAFVTKPVKGAFFSVMSSFTPSTDITPQIRSARIAQGVGHSTLATDKEKLEVVKRWQSEVVKVRLKERRKDWRKAKEEEKDGWILRSEQATGGSGGIVGRDYTVDGSSIVSYGGHNHGHGHARSYSGSSAPPVLVDEWAGVAQSPLEPPAYEGVSEYPVHLGEKEDAERQRRLELERSIAEAERRGYERGLEEAVARDKGKQK